MGVFRISLKVNDDPAIKTIPSKTILSFCLYTMAPP